MNSEEGRGRGKREVRERNERGEGRGKRGR